LLQLQTAVSDRIIAALDTWGDLRDRSLEQVFPAIYGTPGLQALVGIRAADESPRRQPGIEAERIAFVRERIGEIKARIAEGGLREAVIRSASGRGPPRARDRPPRAKLRASPPNWCGCAGRPRRRRNTNWNS
jgi:hypothetical protein